MRSVLVLWAQMLDRFQRQIVSLSTTRSLPSLPCPHEQDERETVNPVQRVQSVELSRTICECGQKLALMIKECQRIGESKCYGLLLLKSWQMPNTFWDHVSSILGRSVQCGLRLRTARTSTRSSRGPIQKVNRQR